MKGLDFLGMFNINFGLITRELSENHIPLEKFMAIAFFKNIVKKPLKKNLYYIYKKLKKLLNY